MLFDLIVKKKDNGNPIWYLNSSFGKGRGFANSGPISIKYVIIDRNYLLLAPT
jgi:hypothetical protein